MDSPICSTASQNGNFCIISEDDTFNDTSDNREKFGDWRNRRYENPIILQLYRLQFHLANTLNKNKKTK
jgi:hypothetical protein